MAVTGRKYGNDRDGSHVVLVPSDGMRSSVQLGTVSRRFETGWSCLLTAGHGAVQGVKRRVALVLALGGIAGLFFASAASAHWVGTWSASPSDASPFVPSLSDQTVRMVVAPHFGGGWVRVHLSNRFGTSPVVLDRVEIALRAGGPALVPGSRRAVRFGGRRVVRIPTGADVVSDAVRLRFAAFQDLAVSVYVAGSIAHPTEHLVTRQTSYLTPRGSGDHASDRIGEAFTGLTAAGGYSTGWYFLDGIDVRAARKVGAVVAVGDSITDGFESNENALTESPAGLNQNGRWPDDLARRLLRAHRQLSVLNAGISGNRVLSGNPLFGPSALARLQRDVVDEAGVRDVIVLEGINDIGLSPSASPSSIIGGLKRIVLRLRAAHLHVLLGTLTPARGTPLTSYGGVTANEQREQVNHWIRSQHMVQVVDFDKAVRDPRHPDRLSPRYDDGDHLHLSLAGYRAMAAAVDLAELR